jgi:NADH-quinone oxidoreductase subunit H
MKALDHIFLTAKELIAEQLTAFGVPSWLVVVIGLVLPAAVCVAVFAGFFAFLTWLERKVLSRIQNRYGPNRVGPFGLFQPIADGMKAITKEDLVPRGADPLLHLLAPVLIVVFAVSLYAVLPFGRGMVPAEVNVGVLLFFALSSVASIGLFLAGWGSRNKFSLLGAMRAVAQMISYELPVVMTAVPAVMIGGSMRLSDIVASQGPNGDATFFQSVAHWNVWTPWGVVGFIAFFIAGMAELNRSPFDIAEGESEIVAGFHTEYSGMKFALFFMGEYLSAIAFSGLASTLFLGGWWGPAFLPSWAWFFGKIFMLMLLMMWIRGTLPRLRADQLMGFSWKLLLPMAFMNIIATGVWFHIPKRTFGEQAVAWIACALILLPSYFLFARLSSSKVQFEKRTYTYAKFDKRTPPAAPTTKEAA